MKTPLQICKKYYPKVYELYTRGNDECKMIAYNIYYHNYGTTFNKEIVDLCKNLGFHIENDDVWTNCYKIF